ncbi:MAG: SH3 domain-containing protein [Arcobacteraceae bacterium]
MNKLKILIIITITMILYTGCATQQIERPIISDVQNIKQDPSLYTEELQSISLDKQKEFLKDFGDKYFYPWHLSKFTVSYKNATWGNIYSKRKVYSENLTLISQKWFDDIIKASNFSKFDTVRKKAITVNNSHIKVFPTVSKIFYDPNEAGEGFPFDYNENSSIKINTPVFISHLSQDKLWAYVESSVTIGWIKISDIAYVDTKFINTFENTKYYVSLKDDINIYKNGYQLSRVKLGTLFPKAKKGFIIASKDYKNNAFLRVIDQNANIQKIGLKFNLENIKKLSDELIGERYGWGGLHENRDCSLMTKDFYTPFGIFLQRNSRLQKGDGRSMDISDLSNQEKKEFILKNAIAFKTLIYLPGHIMIYIGEKDNEPLIFHNMWGVKTIDKSGKYGRSIVGRAVVTTLTPGSEISNHLTKYSILSNIEAITILTE